MNNVLHLIIPAFVAGLFTFLAPCTLPLVPAYLGFISGASAKQLSHPELLSKIRGRVVLNGVFYVLGFSSVFIILGVIFGLGGSFLASYQMLIARMGGILIVFFGLYLMHVFDRMTWLRTLSIERRLPIVSHLKPGVPVSSFVLGAVFAFGWTPCIGPILGSILLLVTSSATVAGGAFLLSVFSLGLAIPFLAFAIGISHATQTVKSLTRFLPLISFLGGLFLLVVGLLILSNQTGFLSQWIYEFLSVFDYERVLDYL